MAVRVLIADGSRTARDILRQHLEIGGCQVVAETETAQQAIDLYRTTRPQVVMLDIGLKSIDGQTALSVFRTIRRESPETSIVMVPAARRPDDARVFVRAGALDCVVASFNNYAMALMWRRLSETYPELRRPIEPGSER
jgi:CheY-like chemotaxis protein